MDTSNFELEFFGSEDLVPKFKDLSQFPKNQKTVYSVQFNNSDSESSEGPCGCLEKCLTYAMNENEYANKSSMPKEIKHSIETLQSIKERVLNGDKIDDEFSHFGKNIASQLRQLPIADALNIQLEILSMLKAKRELQLAKLEGSSSSSSYTTEYTFEIQNTVSKVGCQIPNTEEVNK